MENNREENELEEYTRYLLSSLQWNAMDNHEKSNLTASINKQQFIDALTEIAALPADGLNMEIRLKIVDSTTPSCLSNIITAMEHRDVHLKCKASCAIGSLCTSRVAGQMLLQLCGQRIFVCLKKMLHCKNRWAQGDSCFVLGWITVIADENILLEISTLIPIVVRIVQQNLQRQLLNLETRQGGLSDHNDDNECNTNVCIYALVFLLNCSQRDLAPLLDGVDNLMKMLHSAILLCNLIHSHTVDMENILNNTIEASNAKVQDHELQEMNMYSPRIEYDDNETWEIIRLVISILSYLFLKRCNDVIHAIQEYNILPSLSTLRDRLKNTTVANEFENEDISIQSLEDVNIETWKNALTNIIQSASYNSN